MAGPGTHLKREILRWNIVAGACDTCDQHVAEMDQRGVQWCRENEATILGWLRESARLRGICFFEPGARWLVRRAIKAAERDERRKIRQDLRTSSARIQQ